MTIKEIKNLDFYKCSLQDLNKGYDFLTRYLQKLIINGHAIENNFKGSDKYIEVKNLHVLMSRAKSGMDKEGYMINFNIKSCRLPNSKSILQS